MTFLLNFASCGHGKFFKNDSAFPLKSSVMLLPIFVAIKPIISHIELYIIIISVFFQAI